MIKDSRFAQKVASGARNWDERLFIDSGNTWKFLSFKKF